MPIEDFWYGDVRLLQVYELAYFNRTSYNNWLLGNRVYEAVYKSVSNILSSKSAKKQEYSDMPERITMDVVNKTPKEKSKIARSDFKESFNAWASLGVHTK